MEPTLAVIGLNYRTSPVAVREWFWIGESQRYEALRQLLRCEGIEEALILASRHTEFLIWANDLPAAANSALRFLTHDYQLKLCNWSHFYRLMDDVAFTHVFQVASGVDSARLGEPKVASELRDACEQARTLGTTGRFLDAVVQKALAVSVRARRETSIAESTYTYPYAVVIDLAVPRNIDSRAGEIGGVFLFDLDSFEPIVKRDTEERRDTLEASNRIIAGEVEGFRRRLMAERVVPTIVGLRHRLDDLCRQEVEFLPKGLGPFTEDQDQVLTTLAAHFTQRIASTLARQLRELPDRTGQDMLATALHRLFHLDNPEVVETGPENQLIRRGTECLNLRKIATRKAT